MGKLQVFCFLSMLGNDFCSSALFLSVTTTKVAVGNSVSFKCSTGNTKLTVSKWKRGHTLLDESDSHYFFSGQMSFLLISALIEDDDGLYTCFARDKDGTEMASNIVSLSVVGKPQVYPTDSQAVVGSTATLQCKGNGISTIFWSFKGVFLHNKSRYYQHGAFGELLDVTNVTLRDGGKYNCTASNGLLTASAFPRLDVLYDPVVTLSPLDLTVMVGFDALFTCNVTAFPRAAITWMWNGADVQKLGSARHIVTPADNHGVGALLIVNADVIDVGNIRCQAKNSAGTVSATVTLNVTLDDKASHFKPSRRKTIFLGSNGTLDCDLQSPINQLDVIVWTKNGQSLSQTNNIQISEVSLSINNATFEDTGTYQCRINRKMLPANLQLIQKVFVTVRGPPFAPQLVSSQVIIKLDFFMVVLNWTTLFDGNSPITKCSVHWLLLGNSSTFEGHKWNVLQINSNRNSAVFFTNGSKGTETCAFCVTAYNRLGLNKSKIVQVPRQNFVQKGPSFSPPLPSSYSTSPRDFQTKVVDVTAGASGFPSSSGTPGGKNSQKYPIVLISSAVGGSVFVIFFVTVLIIRLRPTINVGCKYGRRDETRSDKGYPTKELKTSTSTDVVVLRYSKRERFSSTDSEKVLIEENNPLSGESVKITIAREELAKNSNVFDSRFYEREISTMV